MILTVNCSPAIQIYAASGERASLTADITYQALASTGPIILSEDETPSVSIDCDNVDELGAELVYCAGETATLSHSGATVFSGVVRRVSADSARVSLTLEASAGATPYTAKIQLRETTAWGVFRAKATIPVVYGRTAVEPLEYTPDRKTFVLADHAVQGIDAVYRNNLPEQGYGLRIGADSAGVTVSFIDLVEPLGDGEALRVELRGKMDSSGALIETAEAIARDLGVTGLPAGLPEYPLASVLDEQRSLRAILIELFGSVGRAFVPLPTGIAAPELWPSAAPAADTAYPPPAANWRAEVAHVPVGTLRLAYAYDAEQGGERAAVELTADDGEADVDISAPWLTRVRDALALANDAALWKFQQVVQVSLDYESVIDVEPGDWLTVDCLSCPWSGERLQVSGVEIDYSRATTLVKLLAINQTSYGPLSTTLADGYYPVAQALALVTRTQGRIDAVIRDATGQPMVAADVTLDGVVTRRTDNAGSVSFDGVPIGEHQLVIEREGFAAQVLEVTV